MAKSTSSVELGFLAEEEDNESLLKSVFPSKIGGKPSWLEPINLPRPEQLQCDSCENPLSFLLQIYTPIDDQANCFHRTIYVFACRKADCPSRSYLAFRTQLARENKFYSYDPVCKTFRKAIPQYLVNLCSVCGGLGPKTCSKCKSIQYCSKSHQIIDWKTNHKKACSSKTTDSLTTNNNILWDEYAIEIDSEDLDEKSENEDKINEKAAEYEKLLQENKVAGTSLDLDDSELANFTGDQKQDKTFLQFRKRVAAEPGQILRYERNGKPLNISDQKCPNIPNCDYCGAERTFEFQVMPQILNYLKEFNVDFGTLQVFTCSKSCNKADDVIYKKEFVFNQTVSHDAR